MGGRARRPAGDHARQRRRQGAPRRSSPPGGSWVSVSSRSLFLFGHPSLLLSLVPVCPSLLHAARARLLHDTCPSPTLPRFSPHIVAPVGIFLTFDFSALSFLSLARSLLPLLSARPARSLAPRTPPLLLSRCRCGSARPPGDGRKAQQCERGTPNQSMTNAPEQHTSLLSGRLFFLRFRSHPARPCRRNPPLCVQCRPVRRPWPALRCRGLRRKRRRGV